MKVERKKYLLEKGKRNREDENYNALKGLTKLTSGKLAASNHFCLTNDAVLGLAQKKKRKMIKRRNKKNTTT